MYNTQPVRQYDDRSVSHEIRGDCSYSYPVDLPWSGDPIEGKITIEMNCDAWEAFVSPGTFDELKPGYTVFFKIHAVVPPFNTSVEVAHFNLSIISEDNLGNTGHRYYSFQVQTYRDVPQELEEDENSVLFETGGWDMPVWVPFLTGGAAAVLAVMLIAALIRHIAGRRGRAQSRNP